jgi:hypothetical protein
VVSISGCDPLDPGSNPGTAITFFCRFVVWEAPPRELFVYPPLARACTE